MSKKRFFCQFFKCPSVWITISHMNSGYYNCKVVNHKKKQEAVFSQGKFNSSILYFFRIISTPYPRFIHTLHTVIKKNIAYTQNYMAK